MAYLKFRALPPPDEALFPNGSVLYSKFCLNDEIKRKIDAAGAAFQIFYKERILGQNSKQEEEETKQEQEYAKEHIKDWEKKRKKKTESELLQEQLQDDDLYSILGLGELGMGATLQDIKSAYRKMALQYHPDKQAAGQTQTDPMWLKVQKAYETLTDPEKKKKYDSTIKFDDSIPEELVDPSKFFEIFGPVFQRNSIWSTKKNVPHLGDNNTPIKEVNKFYDFWENFDSWRDFSVYDEYNLDEAESRYERRYMERENKRIKGGHLKKERQRIMRLVELAKNQDPRIIKAKKEEEEQRLKKKMEQQMKKEKMKQERLDKEKKEEEERLAKEKQKEEEEKKEKEKKQKQQEDLKKAIKTLRGLFKEKIDSPQYDRFFLESLLENMKYDDICSLNLILEQAQKDKGVDALEKFIGDLDKLKSFRKQQQEVQTEKIKQQEKEEKKSKEIPWSVEELSQLAKALIKYPVGSKNRWECIATFLGGSRTVDEVIAKAKDMSKNQSLKTTGQTISKDAFVHLKNQPGVMKDVGAAPDKRIVFDQTNVPLEGKDSIDIWTQTQQQQLEKALKEYPANIDPQERWTKIAACVEGKTKKQCVDRFKELRNAVLNKKVNAQ